MNRTFAKTIATLITAATFACLTQRGVMGADRMTVHEWGTFTAVQNEDGEELPGINIDDEPVPSFVYNLEPYLLGKPVLSSRYWHLIGRLISVRSEVDAPVTPPPHPRPLTRQLLPGPS